MFACFSAGTPSHSVYVPWLEQLKTVGRYDRPASEVLSALPRAGEPPFVAALPQKALAHPEGPLGVIGHVDLAWTWSFLEDVATDSGASARVRHERFQGILRSVLKGRRFGVAHGELTHFFGEVSRSLLTTYDESTAKPSADDDRARRMRRADLWMQRQDLAGHVLLGDPAARLQLTPPPAGIPEREPDADSGSRVGFAARTPRPIELSHGPDLRDMEAAVLAYLRDAGSADIVAKRCGISRADLLSFVETYQEWGRRGLAQRKK